MCLPFSSSGQTLDTIVAPITAAGAAAVSVVRLSGEQVPSLLERIVSKPEEVLSEPRKMFLRDIRDVLNDDSILDYACVCYFKAPFSFTGEDILEFHLHGSSFIVSRLIENLVSLGARYAKPGEFTERAYHNGKVDLTQAEAVADLIAAETAEQARVARNQLEGRLSLALSELGDPLRDLCAELEAHIDFPDEGIDPASVEGWVERVNGVLVALNRYIASYATGRILREGAQIVLVGIPNAGKSSLLNAFVGDERVIVTPIPGTTRDSIEEVVSIDGIKVRMWDTAGLAGAHTIDEVERIGIEHSWKRARSADLLLFVYDLSSSDEEQISLLTEVQALGNPLLIVANKSDVNAQIPRRISGATLISAKTGEGVQVLKKVIASHLVSARNQSDVLITTARHCDALKKARLSLEECREMLKQGHSGEVSALLLRSALGALDEIIGATTTDDILGLIFSKFCIGK